MQSKRQGTDSPSSQRANRPDRSLFWLGKYLSLALTLPASVVAGYFLGEWASHLYHSPLLQVIGIFLGMAGGIVQIVRELTRDSR